MASRGCDGSRGRTTDAKDWVGRLLSHSVEDERTVKICYHKYVYIAKSEVEMKTERKSIRLRRNSELSFDWGGCDISVIKSLKFRINGTTLEFHL